jgi:hypothetical protein
MRKRWPILLIGLVWLASTACLCSAPAAPTPPAPAAPNPEAPAAPTSQAPAGMPPAELELILEHVFHQPYQAAEQEVTNNPTTAGEGDRVRIPREGKAVLKWPDLHVMLYRATKLERKDLKPTWWGLGSLVGTVVAGGKLQPDQRLTLSTDTAEITLSGTTVMAAYHPETRLTILRVFDGQAEIRNLTGAAETRRVSAGEWALVGPDGKAPQVSGDLPAMRGLARELGLWDTFHEAEQDVKNGFGPEESRVAPSEVAIVFVEEVAPTSPTEIPAPAEPTQAPGKAIVVLHNNTQTTIAHVYFGTAQWGGWSGEQLGDPIQPGGSYTWQLQPGAGIYDLRAEDGSHETLDQTMSVSISGTYDWNIGEARGAHPVAPAQPTSAPAPNPTPYITCSPDHTIIDVGDCTVLSWDVQNVQAVYLDGEAVSVREDREVCPREPHYYRLRIVTETGDLECNMTVDVGDRTPPVISEVWFEPTKPRCDVDGVVIYARVTDRGQVARVETWGSANCEFPTARSMTPAGGDLYRYEYGVMYGGQFCFDIRAWDAFDNMVKTTDLQQVKCIIP